MVVRFGARRRRSRAVLLALVLLLLSCCRPPHATAQPNATIGVKGGVSFARFAGDAHETQERRGFVGGVQIDVPASPIFAVRGEALYHEMGARQVPVGSVYMGTGQPRLPLAKNVRWNCLECALLAKVRPFGSQVYYLAGPAVGVVLSRKDIYVHEYDLEELAQRYPDSNDPLQHASDNLILHDLGMIDGRLLLGIGATARVGAATLQWEVRYQWGMQDQNRATGRELYNRDLTVMTGLLF